MKITIVFPEYYSYPVGGYKVEYEYANRLQAGGHQVTIVYPQMIKGIGGWKRPLRKLRWASRVRRQNRPLVNWFRLDPDVRTLLIADLEPRHIPPADAVVATNWQTAEMVGVYPPSKGVKFYMVYDYEYWMTADEDIRRRMGLTYQAGMHMIATSPAVVGMLEENGGVPIAYIPCGTDFNVYGVDVPLEQRNRLTVGFPVRREHFKGTDDAIEAVTLLKQRHGDSLRVKAFGSLERPPMPDWIEYSRRPSDAELRAFYNSLSVFLFPSHYEGWGLTGTEALACGAALVASDSVGLRDYARDGETALLVPPQRPDLLAAAVDRLLGDEALRRCLARQGNAHVQQFNWSRAFEGFEGILQRYVSGDGAGVEAGVRD